MTTDEKIPEVCHHDHLWICTRMRFVMLIYLLLCLTSIWCNILSFNIAIICMHPHRLSASLVLIIDHVHHKFYKCAKRFDVYFNVSASPFVAYFKAGAQNASVSSEALHIAQKNDTTNETTAQVIADIEQSNDPATIGTYIEEVIWLTPQDKSILISAVAVGSLIAHFPTMWLINHFGIRMVFGLLGLLSACTTISIPFAARTDLSLFVALRLLQGISFASNFSVIGSFLSKWSYFKQSGLFISVLVAFIQLSPAITMPTGGYICANFQWPYIYYIHGIVSFFLFSFFIIIYRNSPKKHPFVSDIELKKIDIGKENISKAELRAVPYAQILSSTAVWTIWICAMINFYYENIVFLYAPTYLHAVLGFQVHDTGITAAIPPILHFAIKISCGFASDKVKLLSDTAKVKCFNTLAFIGCATCLFILGTTNTDQRLLCLIMLSVSTGFLGFTPGGFYKSASLVARHYTAFVTGNVSLTMMITMLGVPFVATTIAPDNSTYQWQIIFFSTGALCLMAAVIFLIFGTAEPASWARSTINANNNELKKTDTEAKDGTRL